MKPGSLGPVFSASLVGILFGSALFGWVGDRYGRKAALVWSNLLFGVFTLAAAYSTNLDQMFWLRLLAGLGIGGVIPNVVAINAESAPRKLRATLAIIAVGCVPIGGAIPGFVTAALRAATRLANLVSDRRHRADHHCPRRADRHAGIDQVHGAARKPARQDGALDQ